MQAEANAAEEARRQAEEEAAAEAKRKREVEREAARQALLKVNGKQQYALVCKTMYYLILILDFTRTISRICADGEDG